MQARVRAQTSSLCMCTVPNWCRAKSCSPDLDVTRTHAYRSLCRVVTVPPRPPSGEGAPLGP